MRPVLPLLGVVAFAIGACSDNGAAPSAKKHPNDNVDFSSNGTGETCGNGFDDDRNGLVDEGCVCTPGDKQICCATGAQKGGMQTCYPQNTKENTIGSWGPCEGFSGGDCYGGDSNSGSGDQNTTSSGTGDANTTSSGSNTTVGSGTGDYNTSASGTGANSGTGDYNTSGSGANSGSGDWNTGSGTYDTGSGSGDFNTSGTGASSGSGDLNTTSGGLLTSGAGSGDYNTSGAGAGSGSGSGSGAGSGTGDYNTSGAGAGSGSGAGSGTGDYNTSSSSGGGGCVCAPGTWRWCDTPEACLWGVQICAPDFTWGKCNEAANTPNGCQPGPYDMGCCLNNPNACCENPFNHQSMGECTQQLDCN